jgi:predicted phosphodiesterase
VPERAQRVAVIADVHGNAPALAAVLAEVATLDVDLVVDCGDLLTGPLPAETLALVRGLGDRIRHVRGNAERELVAAYDGGPGWQPPAGSVSGPGDITRHVAAALTPADRELLDRFAPTVVVTVDGLGDVCFCHGTPRSEDEMLTAHTSDERLGAVLADAPARVVVGGHTHSLVDRTVGGIRYVNAGSVGMPYEGEPGAYWVLLGPDVELRRTAYDLDAACARIAASGMPDAEAFAAEFVASSHARDEAAAFFEAQATGAGAG